MFFLMIAANLALYLSSFQLLGTGSALTGAFTLIGGLVMTSLSALFYTWKGNHVVHHGQKKKTTFKRFKKLKKLLPDCDCDCPNCGCDC